MPRTLPIQELRKACDKGRHKIETLTQEWPDTLSAHDRQLELKKAYGQMVEPIRMVMENFAPREYIERAEDDETRKALLLTAFQSVSSINTIADKMKENIVDGTTRAAARTVEEFARRRTRDVCEAYYLYARGGQYIDKSLETKIKYEAGLARKGLFPAELLSGFSFLNFRHA